MVCQIVIIISRVIIPNFTIFVTSKVKDSIFNLYFPDFGFLTNCIKNIYIFISFHIKQCHVKRIIEKQCITQKNNKSNNSKTIKDKYTLYICFSRQNLPPQLLISVNISLTFFIKKLFAILYILLQFWVSDLL